MSTHPPAPQSGTVLRERELRFTATLYAARPGVLKHLKETGRLPAQINMGGVEIQSRLLIERRGTDIELTPEETLVYDAIVREGRLPGDHVTLLAEGRGKSPARK